MAPPPPPAQSSQGRSPSAASVAGFPTRSDSKASKRPASASQAHYTVLVRVPFARGDFVDPPQAEWDATRDQALWKIISRSSRTSELDCEDARETMLGSLMEKRHELAERFSVTPAFILQQAAWLYERHLEHVRAQMRKVGTVRDNGTPVPSGSASGSGNVSGAGGTAMKRIGSAGGHSRVSSALSVRSRDSPIPSKDAGSGATANKETLSRTPSTTTVTQSRLMNVPPSPRQPSNPTMRSSFRSAFPSAAQRKDSPSTNPATTRQTSPPRSPHSSHSSSSADSSDENERANPLRRSQLFKRPPRFNKNTKHVPMPRLSDSDGGAEGESSDDEGFLPFAQRQQKQPQLHQDPSATLRSTTGSSDAPASNTRPLSAVAVGKKPARGQQTLESSVTSASSETSSAAAANQAPGGFPRERIQRTGSGQQAPVGAGGPGALSPRHRAELARLGSPRVRGREGSEGTPSMGSSFSDLDDASVTQSALEEQLMSHMQHGGLSKMSSISQALRSKYL